MYNYYPEVVWTINGVLFGALVVTSIVIFFCVGFKNYFWEMRRRKLLEIKKNIYEMAFSGKSPSEVASQPFVAEVTPQQFLDVETNRNIDAAFFNDSERQLFKDYFTTPAQIARFKKIASGSMNKWRRIEAILALGHTGLESVIGTLRTSLLSRDKDVAYFSLIALGQIKTGVSARVLLEFLRKTPSRGYMIASILENFPQDIADDVISLTNEKDPRVQTWAVTILSKFASLRHIKRIEALVTDPKEEIRAAVCDCLGTIGGGEARTTLVKCLEDDSWLVKRHAIFALEKAMGDRALPDVIGLIHGASWSVVDAVKDVMTRHLKASLPYIEKFIAGEDYVPKKYSIMALKAGLKDLDPSTRIRVAEILTKADRGA